MKSTKSRLLILAAFLTVAAIQSAVSTAQAACNRICWHVSAEESCCQLRTCEIVCG
jgi:hypothetical protein